MESEIVQAVAEYAEAVMGQRGIPLYQRRCGDM